MKRFGFVRLILCLCVFIFSVHKVSALDAALSGDASVNSAHPGVNYGALSNLYVGNGNTAFLQFDLSSLPAGTTSAQVSHATLTVFVNRVNAAGSVTVSPVTAAWGEYSVTSTAAPATGSSIGNLPISVAGEYVSLDVTAQVQAWVTTSASNNGLALASGGANVLFDSKENDETSHAARLDITLVSQGPQGVPGPIGPVGTAGVNGLPGLQGIQGPIGVTGAAGAAGAQGPAGVGMVYQNAYNAGTTYAANDAVTYNGSSYISLQNSNLGHQPDVSPAFWELFAAAGANGPAGPIGVTGATGSIGPQGIQGPTGNTGPAGPTGATGAVGLVGATGATGPDGPIGVTGATGATGATGSIGPQGIQGPIGNTGPVGPTGATGSAGPIGTTGATGPAGSVGTTGAIGPQGDPVSFKGPWNIGATYALGDAVSFNGSSYISIVAGNVGFQPDISNVKWGLLAQAGTTGAAGSPGAQGPAGVAGPSGPTGATGATGPAGASGGGVNAVSFSMQFTNPGTGSAGATYYFSPLYSSGTFTGNTTIGGNIVAMPTACTMSALNVGVNNYNAPSSDVTTLTVYKNGSVTTMSCSVTTNNNGSSCQDKTHTFSVSGGDSISVAFSESNITPFNKVVVNLVCQ